MVEWGIHWYMFWNTTAQLYPIWVCLNLGDTPSWGNFEIDMQNLWFSKEHDLNMVNFPYIWTDAYDNSWDFYWSNPCWNCFDLIFFSSKRLNHQVVVSKFGKPVNPWFLNQAVAAAGATGSYVARLSLTGDPMIWWFLGEWCQVDPSIHFFFLISETVWDLASCDFFRLRIFSPSKMRMLCVVKKTPRSLGWAWNLTHPMGFWLRRQT